MISLTHAGLHITDAGLDTQRFTQIFTVPPMRVCCPSGYFMDF